jgi:hypothetical protein
VIRLRIVVFGSRDCKVTDNQIGEGISALLEPLGGERLLQYSRDEAVYEIVSGGCAGVDMDGERYANGYSWDIKRFPAKWREHGLAAGPMRNRAMAEYATHGLGFWKRNSRGTANMATWLLAMNKPVKVVLL